MLRDFPGVTGSICIKIAQMLGSHRYPFNILGTQYCTALYGGDGQMTVTSPNSRGRRDGVEGDCDSRQFGRPLLNLATWPPNFFQCHANLLTTEATVTVTGGDGGDATAPQ